MTILKVGMQDAGSKIASQSGFWGCGGPPRMMCDVQIYDLVTVHGRMLWYNAYLRLG